MVRFVLSQWPPGMLVASSAKLEGLCACLESIVAQSWAAEGGRQSLHLMISWSASSSMLARQVRELLRELVPDCTVLEQRNAHFSLYASTLVPLPEFRLPQIISFAFLQNLADFCRVRKKSNKRLFLSSFKLRLLMFADFLS